MRLPCLAAGGSLGGARGRRRFRFRSRLMKLSAVRTRVGGTSFFLPDAEPARCPARCCGQILAPKCGQAGFARRKRAFYLLKLQGHGSSCGWAGPRASMHSRRGARTGENAVFQGVSYEIFSFGLLPCPEPGAAAGFRRAGPRRRAGVRSRRQAGNQPRGHRGAPGCPQGPHHHGQFHSVRQIRAL